MVTTQWLGGSGSWDDPANWSNGVPGPADTAVFGTSGSQTVSGSGNVGTLEVTGGDSLALTGDIGTGAATIDNGTLTVAPGATLADTGILDLPGNLGPTDALVIEGQVSDSSAQIGRGNDFGPTTVEVVGTGANWINTGTVDFEASSATIAGGATMSAAAITSQVLFTFLTIDTSSTLAAPLYVDELPGSGGFIMDVVASTLPGARNTLRLADPITGNFNIRTQAGQTLDLLGPITNPASGNGALGLSGNVVLASPANGYAGTVFESAGSLVLNARGAIGTGTIVLADPGFNTGSELAIEAGASGNPDGSTTVFSEAGRDEADTISAVNTPVLAYGGAGQLVFYNGSAASAVYGGSGSVAIFSGAGGGEFFGGPAAII